MDSRRNLLAGLLATTAGLAATTALAQTGFPGGGFPGAGRGRRGPAGEGPERGAARPAPVEDPVDFVEYRLERLREDLRLNADQDRPWQALAGKLRAYGEDLARERTRGPAAGLNALQQIDQAVNAARNRMTALEDVASVAKVWYDTLTPEQKALADSRLAMAIPGAAQPMREARDAGRRPEPR